ncbi:MAG: SDR family oxidoreductase [Candidatus Hydrogenedentes bacterium]|nr:SDR family oxidoreductase [Candidatus Hydrogenedentota bacterium]
MNDILDLSGCIAIVTGAATGIGKATMELLVSLGAHVIATDANEDGIGQSCADFSAEEVTGLRHDVTSEADWQSVFAVAQARGRLDILVNNAGIMLDSRFLDAPVEELRLQYRIHVEGPFIGMQGAIPLMMATVAEHGALPSIINVSSVYGQVAGGRFAAYSASKGAIRMLTKAVANEVASTGIRVNSIHPGPTATKLAANHAPELDEGGNPLPIEQVIANWRRLIPMGRTGSVGDIAPVIAFLASDGARYITGAEIVVDGGYTAV